MHLFVLPIAMRAYSHPHCAAYSHSDDLSHAYYTPNSDDLPNSNAYSNSSNSVHFLRQELFCLHSGRSISRVCIFPWGSTSFLPACWTHLRADWRDADPDSNAHLRQRGLRPWRVLAGLLRLRCVLKPIRLPDCNSNAQP